MANNYPEYTEKVPDGGGLFDEIMSTLKKHIDVEYDKQRIRGADYTKVWLGSMEAALANTTQYLLGNALMDVQRRKIEAEILAIEAEREKTELERDKLQFEINELLPLQKQQLQLQVDKLAAEIPLIQAQIDKIYAETDLIHTQDATAKWNLTHLSPLEKIKLDAEGKLINQRYKSEIAQISTVVDGKTGPVFVLHGFPSGKMESVTDAGATEPQAASLAETVVFGARIGTDGWTAEFKIPFAEIDLVPAKLETFRFNLGLRTGSPEPGEWYAWVRTGRANYAVARAGELRLTPVCRASAPS